MWQGQSPDWRKFILATCLCQNMYVVCSNSIRIGIIVVVHWVGCVCKQLWHIRTCLINAWHKLQVAALAQLAVVGRGSNTSVYVIAICTMCESTEQRICIKFCFKIGKTATETYELLQQAKQQSSQRKGPLSPQPKKGRQVRSKTKVMLLAFFDYEGIVHHEYAPDWQTINKAFYLEVLRCLHESVRWKRTEKWRDGNWILHHDNASAHTSHLAQQSLAKHGTAQLQQLPYSPDLAPCDFFLFPRLKKVLKGHPFEAMEDIKQNSTKTLLDIPKEEFAKCFQQWQNRWAKCVAAEGNYVEDN